ncbi:MAG TPA: ATP-binding protein [Chroococcidiopsis sp.]
MTDRLTDQHQAIAKAQQSRLMSAFAGLNLDGKMLAIAACLGAGMLSAAMAWTGDASDRVFFCLQRPDLSLQCQDAANRPYRMTLWHWQQWGRDGRPAVVVPNPGKGVDGVVAATNPNKAWWALGAFGSLALSGYLLRHLQDEDRQLHELDDLAQKRDRAVAEMAAKAEVLKAYRPVAIATAEIETAADLVRLEAELAAQQLQVYGQAETQIAQIEASDAVFDAQVAGLTDEERQEYLDYLKDLKKTSPFQMPGMTLDQVCNPSDKVEAEPEQPAIASDLSNPNAAQEFDITRLNPPDPTKGKNIAIVAGQGVGKTTLAIYIAGEILKSPDIQVYDLDDTGKTWGNLPVWGTGDDDSEIAGAMQSDADLFERRTNDRVRDRRFPFAVRIMDEVPATFQRIPKAFQDWAFMMTSRARKRAMIAILLTQFRDPALNGIRPEQWRTAFATFYLGHKQVEHALAYLVKPSAIAPGLREALKKCKRPALVYFDDGWYWYDVPDLEEWSKQFLVQTKGKINPASDSQLGLQTLATDRTQETKKRLENLLSQPAPEPENFVELSDRQQAILDYAARKNDWVTASELQSNLRKCRGVSANDLKADFELLTAEGFGEPDTSGRWRYTMV